MSVTQESESGGGPAPDRLDEAVPDSGPARPGGVVDVVRRFRGPLQLLLVAVLLVAAGGWFLVRWTDVRHDGSVANQALVDKATTNQVINAATSALDRIFSYSYNDTDATRQAASAVLTGRAAGQYATLFGQVRQHAVAEKLTLSSRVVSAGVTLLDGDQAQILVFLDQTATRDDTGQTSTSAAQLSITVQLVHGHWMIADIHAR
ncbi:MAG TPA: hypothetical protein VFW65_18530 [Pseudonocardiaceae bacterium]|nr:hypothetical protein [Pseudonocardiaceae bacterium]